MTYRPDLTEDEKEALNRVLDRIGFIFSPGNRYDADSVNLAAMAGFEAGKKWMQMEMDDIEPAE
jgi:hypothetical protein